MSRTLVIAILFIFFFLSISVYAKQKQQPVKSATVDEVVAKMKKQLELTDQQEKEVRPIVENYMAQEAQLKQDENKELKKVLTDQQLFTWNFLQNEPPHEKKRR